MKPLSPIPRCGCEHVPLTIFNHALDASRAVAAEVAVLIRERRQQNKTVVLGLAAGSTPVAFYAELVRLHREEALSFAHVITFNLDEFQSLPPDHPQRRRQVMRAHLFDHIDLPADNQHFPDGATDAGQELAYEEKIQAAGGIDFQILGLGRTGHVGLNEPGSSPQSPTRLVTLDPLTRVDLATEFGGAERTPPAAVSMGLATVLAARRIVVMAWGGHKAAVVQAAIEGPATSELPASLLQGHGQTLFVLDQAAASALTRRRTPWLAGLPDQAGPTWDEPTSRRAVLWLAGQRQKAVLQLTDDNYREAGLQRLVDVYGSASATNAAAFRPLQGSLTAALSAPVDSPASPPVDPSSGLPPTGPAASVPQRVLVLSPHPEDAVMAMGGTIIRLVAQGHDVHIAYQVSGSWTVPDEAIWRSLGFARDSGLLSPTEAGRIHEWCAAFEADGGLPPSPELRRWKGLVRRQEAVAAARVCGVRADRLHFLELPFYESETRPGRGLGRGDLAIMRGLLMGVQPHAIYTAGDLDDPEGTQRLCLRALRDSLALCTAETWYPELELWLYRSAGDGWGPDEIDRAVALGPQDVLQRRRAILRYESQPDPALFLGSDGRDFWQRAEARSRRLAETYRALGLGDPGAIEAFRRALPANFLAASAV